MDIAIAILLLLIMLLCWAMTLLGLPGNWAMVAAAVVYFFVCPKDSRFEMGWIPLVALALLASLGELIEFLAGAMGTAKAGGSRRSAVLAILGSLVGGIGGAIVCAPLIPIPLVGSLIGAIFFASVGALVGAVMGERWKGRDFEHAWQVGKGAFVGRLLGTMGKVLVASLMVATTVVALCL